MEKIIGVYRILNTINNLCYIGISNNIYGRWKTHKRDCTRYMTNGQTNSKLYNAIIKYGIDNFTFNIIETLEHLDVKILQEKEIYWIAYYDSYNNGYNNTIGGDIGGFNRHGDKHPNHKLTLNDVIDIRTKYNEHKRRKEVYKLYSDKIAPSTFADVWEGITWSDVMPEVYNAENKTFHKHNCSNKGCDNGRCILTEQDVYDIRLQRKQGAKFSDVYNQYKHKAVTKGHLQNIWYNYGWEHIQV